MKDNPSCPRIPDISPLVLPFADMADVFRCDTTLEKLVAHLVPSCHIREADGEIGFAVMDEVQFLTFRLCQCCVYPTLLQIAEQCRMLEFLTSNCWKDGSDACWRKEKETGRMYGACSAILRSR